MKEFLLTSTVTRASLSPQFNAEKPASDRLAQQQSQWPATTYEPNTGVGTPYGQMVYLGASGEGLGRYVAGRTKTYRVPDELKTRDGIRAWVIRQLNANNIDRQDLYPSKIDVLKIPLGSTKTTVGDVLKKTQEVFSSVPIPGLNLNPKQAQKVITAGNQKFIAVKKAIPFLRHDTFSAELIGFNIKARPKEFNGKQITYEVTVERQGQKAGVFKTKLSAPFDMNQLRPGTSTRQQIIKILAKPQMRFVDVTNGVVQYKNQSSETVLRTVIQEKQILTDGYWKNTGYVTRGIEKYFEDPDEKNQVESLASQEAIIKDVQQKPVLELSQARERVNEQFKYGGLVATHDRTFILGAKKKYYIGSLPRLVTSPDRMEREDKFLYMLNVAWLNASDDMKPRIKALMRWEAAAVLTAYLAAHAFGVGQLADAIALVLLGKEAIEIASKLFKCWQLLENAKNPSDLVAAGELFSDGGTQLITALLTLAVGLKVRAAAKPIRADVSSAVNVIRRAPRDPMGSTLSTADAVLTVVSKTTKNLGSLGKTGLKVTVGYIVPTSAAMAVVGSKQLTPETRFPAKPIRTLDLELNELAANPEEYLKNNYRYSKWLPSDYLIRENVNIRPGEQKYQWRLPLDLYVELAKSLGKNGKAKLGLIFIPVIFRGKKIQVAVFPPWKNEGEFKTSSASDNPQPKGYPIQTVQWGPNDGAHIQVQWTKPSFNQPVISQPQGSLRAELGPNIKPNEVDVRAQQTTLSGGFGFSTPWLTFFDNSRLQPINGRSRIYSKTSFSIGKGNFYGYVGSRVRYTLSTGNTTSWSNVHSRARSTRFLEIGTNPELMSITNVDSSGNRVTSLLNPYIEKESYMVDYRGQTGIKNTEFSFPLNSSLFDYSWQFSTRTTDPKNPLNKLPGFVKYTPVYPAVPAVKK
jgi:hypothetical protein